MAIERGSLVLLEYVGKLADGTVIMSAHRDGDPSSEVATGIELVSVGDPAYPVIKGLDQALANAEVNIPQTVTVQPADAYGERRRDQIKMLPIRKLEGEETRVGDEVTVGGAKGVVLSMGSGRVRIDFNHKHAGKSITIDFTVLKRLESDADKVSALLTKAEILPGSDLLSIYENMEGTGDDELDDDLADLDDELGLDDKDDLSDKDELDKDLDAGDESGDAELETALDDDDLDAELDKALDRDLGLDDKGAEPAKDLDDDDLDLDDKDLEAEDLDLDDDDLDDDDDDLEDLDDLDDDDLDDLDDDLDLEDDLDDNVGGLDPYANIPGYLLANNVLTVAIPPAMYRSPDIQDTKFALQMDIFKFVPNIKTVRFVETHQNVAV